MLLLPKLQNLPNTFPTEGAVCIELVEVIPIFRASSTVRERIDALLEKNKFLMLDFKEKRDLDLYEEVDDYLSLVNRAARNMYLYQIRLINLKNTPVLRQAQDERPICSCPGWLPNGTFVLSLSKDGRLQILCAGFNRIGY